MKKFRYSLLRVWATAPNEIVDKLNEEGKDGWQVVSVVGNQYLLMQEIHEPQAQQQVDV